MQPSDREGTIDMSCLQFCVSEYIEMGDPQQEKTHVEECQLDETSLMIIQRVVECSYKLKKKQHLSSWTLESQLPPCKPQRNVMTRVERVVDYPWTLRMAR